MPHGCFPSPKQDPWGPDHTLGSFISVPRQLSHTVHLQLRILFPFSACTLQASSSSASWGTEAFLDLPKLCEVPLRSVSCFFSIMSELPTFQYVSHVSFWALSDDDDTKNNINKHTQHLLYASRPSQHFTPIISFNLYNSFRRQILFSTLL